VKIYILAGRQSHEIPSDYMIMRGSVDEKIINQFEEMSVEVAPGVRVGLLSYGQHVLPDRSIVSGAMIAVDCDEHSVPR
jgi:hypothetical protein